MAEIELSREAFLAAITDAVQVGKEQEQLRVLQALTEDALIQIGLDAKVLTYLVEMLEL